MPPSLINATSTYFTLSRVVVDGEIKNTIEAWGRRVSVRERTHCRRVGRVAVREEDVPDGTDDRRVIEGIRARRWRDLRAGLERTQTRRVAPAGST